MGYAQDNSVIKNAQFTGNGTCNKEWKVKQCGFKQKAALPFVSKKGDVLDT